MAFSAMLAYMSYYTTVEKYIKYKLYKYQHRTPTCIPVVTGQYRPRDLYSCCDWPQWKQDCYDWTPHTMWSLILLWLAACDWTLQTTWPSGLLWLVTTENTTSTPVMRPCDLHSCYIWQQQKTGPILSVTRHTEVGKVGFLHTQSRVQQNAAEFEHQGLTVGVISKVQLTGIQI